MTYITIFLLQHYSNKVGKTSETSVNISLKCEGCRDGIVVAKIRNLRKEHAYPLPT